MDCKITKKMINAYVESIYRAKDDKTKDENIEDEEFIKQAAKDSFFNDIKKEIIELEKEKIKREANEEIKILEQKRRINQIKTLMYEGFIIAFLVGLIVNQATEIINVTKGIETKVIITLLIIIALGIITLIVYKSKFLGDVSDTIKQKEE